MENGKLEENSFRFYKISKKKNSNKIFNKCKNQSQRTKKKKSPPEQQLQQQQPYEHQNTTQKKK